MNSTLLEMAELSKKIQSMVFVMEEKNSELEESLRENIESKFRQMLHDLEELRKVAMDANIEFCHMSTTVPCDYYNNHIQVSFFKSTTNIHINALQNGITGKGIFLYALGINEHFYDVERCNNSVAINAVYLLIKNWNVAYEELQIELCKEIQKKINLDIVNSTNRYNELQKRISEL